MTKASYFAPKEEVEFFYDLKFPRLVISFYTALLMPFGFPPPVPVRRKLGISQNIAKRFSPSNLSPLPSLIHPPIDFKALRHIVQSEDPGSLDLVQMHFERMYGAGVLILNAFAALVALLFAIAFLIHPLRSLAAVLFAAPANRYQQVGTIFASCALLGIAIILLLIVVKLHFRLMESSFADSICARELLYLLADLSRNDAISRPSRKRIVIHRIDYLARVFLLIPSQYSVESEKKQYWAKSHFGKISVFIQERSSWVVAPSDETLSELRKDFRYLFDLCSSGNYGNFRWEGDSCLSYPAESSLKYNLADGAIRLAGIAVPLIAMGAYLSPLRLWVFGSNAPIDTEIVAYVFFAWMLISVDITFRLGVIQSLISVAQGLKGIAK